MKKLFIAFFFFMLISRPITAQKETGLITYRRSSIATIMFDDTDKSVYGSFIRDFFTQIPIPDKFNNHNISTRSFTLSHSNSKDLNNIFKYGVSQYQIANALIGKWYNKSVFHGFNMDLIASRGLYDATELQAGIAEKSVRGRALLKDAGQELIGNTFVVVIWFKYTDKKQIGALVSGYGGSLLASVGLGAGQLLTSAASQTLARGYIVKVNACLYQLKWNDELQSIFETKYWDHPQELDDASEFSLDLIGEEVAWADVQSTQFSKKPETELLKRATARAVDAVISKLQSKYEVFRVKTPLLTTEPEITAKIGLKEGVEPKDKYEVLEQIIDPQTGITTYKRRAVISVDKKYIWDNRYNAGEERRENGETDDPVEYTSFKGKTKNIYPGMLIRQIN